MERHEMPTWESVLVKVSGIHNRCHGTRRLQMALRQKWVPGGPSALANGHAPPGSTRVATGLHSVHDQPHPWLALRSHAAAQPVQAYPSQPGVSLGHFVLLLADGTWANLSAS